MNVEDIESSSFLDSKNKLELESLAKSIRKFIIDIVKKNGGHLSSNLGTIESIIALHKIFNVKKNFFYYDIGHQAYTHKILTGRGNLLKNLKKIDGATPLLNFKESIHDHFESGRSSTSTSVALGHAIARKINKKNYEIIIFIGDASFSNGIVLQSLNYVNIFKSKIIIVLNDNNMAISPSVGNIKNLLNQKVKKRKKQIFNLQKLFINKNHKNNIFKLFSIDYLGPINGHNFNELTSAYKFAKEHNDSIIIHIYTKKGLGVKEAENDKLGIYHSVQPNFNLLQENKTIKRSFAFTLCLVEQMKKDSNIISIASGMASPNNSGLLSFKKQFPTRIYDVAIAEELQALLVQGFQKEKFIVYLDYYSAFISRAYDLIIHDISRINCPAVIALHESGFSPKTGNTHHVLYDIANFINIPNTIMLNPLSFDEINDSINFAFHYAKKFKKIVFIRGSLQKINCKNINKLEPKILKLGKWKYFYNSKNPKFYIISYNYNLNLLRDAIVKKKINCTLINAIFIKPIDLDLLKTMISKNKWIFVYEDTYINSGLGTYILTILNRENIYYKKIKIFNSELNFPNIGTVGYLKDKLNNSVENVLNYINKIS